MKIRIKNYQSIKDQSVEVKPGQFACLVGRSDIGKSALIRSVSGLLSNAPANSEVRLGEDYLQVKLEPDEDTAITWKKGPKNNEYVLKLPDQKQVKSAKGGRDVPSEFGELNLLPIKDQDVDENLLVREQFDPPFLENDPRGVASLISRLGSLAEITKARTLADKDIKSDKAELRRLGKQREELNPQIELLSPLKKLTKLVRNTLPDKIKTVNQNKEQLSRLLKLTQRRQELENRLRKAVKILGLLKEQHSIIYGRTKEKSDEMKNLLSLRQVLAKRGKQKKVLDKTSKGLLKLEHLPPAEELNNSNPQRVVQVAKKLDKKRKLREFLEKRQMLAGKKLPKENTLKNAENNLSILPSILKRTKLKEGLDSIIERKERTETKAKTLQQALDSIDVCPLCERPFEENQS